MSRKVIVATILAAAVAVALYYYFNRNAPLSPPGETELTSGDLTVSISYSRPSVRGRVIFGTAEQGALQPYGIYWRLGANEATQITISRDATFNGQTVKAGTYRMYAIPGAESFELVLNSELGQSGSDEPKKNLDVIRTTVPVKTVDVPVEQFTITTSPREAGAMIVFEWSNVRLEVPVE